jgi:hypothetical protein
MQLTGAAGRAGSISLRRSANRTAAKPRHHEIFHSAARSGSGFRLSSTGIPLMPTVIDPFILWPASIALGGWLFFVIAKRM